MMKKVEKERWDVVFLALGAGFSCVAFSVFTLGESSSIGLRITLFFVGVLFFLLGIIGAFAEWDVLKGNKEARNGHRQGEGRSDEGGASSQAIKGNITIPASGFSLQNITLAPSEREGARQELEEGKVEEAPVVPDAVTPLVGYRVWGMGDLPVLFSANGTFWGPGENEARCIYRNRANGELNPCKYPPTYRHEPGCGFYALHRLEMNYNFAVQIAGVALGWGRVIEGEDGWRSQYAQVVCLLGANPRAEEIARKYGVPVVDTPWELEEMADNAQRLATVDGVPIDTKQLFVPDSVDIPCRF